MRELAVGTNEAGQRLDKLLRKYMQLAPDGFLYKMLRKKNIVLNGKKATGKEMLQEQDRITLYLSEETIRGFQKTIVMPAHVPMPDILYEDAQVLILNKPCGMLSQKAAPGDLSMIDIAIAYLISDGTLTEEQLKSFRPGICNRLDRNTSGIVVVGKTLAALKLCNRLIADKSVRKLYLTVVEGRMEKPVHVGAYLRKEAGNQAVILDRPEAGAKWMESAYVPLGYTGTQTVLQVELFTGRTHQIRAHLSHIGHPVAGDFKYNPKAAKSGLKYQLLHSYCMIFPEEAQLGALSGKTITAPLPETFQKYLPYCGENIIKNNR